MRIASETPRSTPGGRPFQIICEVEPATQPDLMHVRHQIGVLSSIATAFLIPDNHIGRATVSSIAVAHEVALMGGRAIACLNAHDRNLLGFRRDLLTAAAYGVDEFLFVYGDRPESGKRSDDLTVRRMIGEARDFSGERAARPFRIGVSSGPSSIPAWKATADALFAQVTFDADRLVSWRRSIEFDGPVYAGVMVVASAAMGVSSPPRSHNSPCPTRWWRDSRVTAKPVWMSPANSSANWPTPERSTACT